MSEFDARAHVESALVVVIEALGPVVAERFRELVPSVSEWTDIVRQKDRQAGREVSRYNPKDLSLLLRALTEPFGTLGYPFTGILTRQAQSCASELRNVRNKWAHNEDFTVAETYRAVDSAEILLRALTDDERADRLTALKAPILVAMAAEGGGNDAIVAGPDVEASPAPVGGQAVSGIAPAGEVVGSPHVGELSSSEASARIAVRSLATLSYAQARNAIAVVDEITIDFRGPEMRGASVEVEAVCRLGSLGDPKVVIVDLDGQGDVTLRNADLMLDPARMFAVEHPVQGVIRVTLRGPDGAVVAQHDQAVEVLAGNQWRANPPQLGAELLASFVQPQAPAIASLLIEASERLRSKTGDSGLDGYLQGSRERVDAIAESIYESMRARDIRYAVPPASWGLEGQKVRTPAEVLDGRLGTCLDLAVTFAAALEEAGINSTLWIVPGHIFLGYWRDAASLDGPAQMDAAEAVNYVGIGQIELVETTFLTGGTEARPFADARRHHHLTTLAGDISVVQSITDVQQARMARIYPLPSRQVSESGDAQIVEYAAAPLPGALHYAPSAEAIGGGAGRELPPRVAQWKNALLDLSLRNRLINYGEKSGYPLAVPQPVLAAFEDMINSGNTITLVPSDRIPTVEGSRGIRYGQDLPESTRAAMLTDRKQAFVGVTESTYTARLRALAYKARTILEETGANNLYLAFGMLRWTFNDRELRSPLILVPVALESAGRGSTFRVSIDEAGESTPNYCLLEKLRLSFGLDIPGLANPAKDDSGIDLQAAFAATRQALTAARLPFTVEDSVDLSILQFAKYRLWKDLDENWSTLAENSLVRHLIRTPTAEYVDPAPVPADVDLDALGNAVPVSADSSQLQAVAEANAGRTFVLEGPPGTGKSQTITNLLAHSLANGRRVLFVAEKRAALDVVKSRLDAVGLGPFSLDLHDKGARPAAVRAQIRAAIEVLARPDGAALKAATETAATSRGALKRYAQRLHEPNAAGLSLYSAREQLLASVKDVEALEIPASVVAIASEEQFEYLRELLRSLPETADLAHPAPLHPWGFVKAQALDRVDVKTLHAAAQEFDAALSDVVARQANASVLRAMTSPADIDTWAALANAPRHSLDVVDAVRARTLSGEIPALHARLLESDAERTWFAKVGPEALDGDVHAVHRAAVAADGSGFFGRRKRQRAALHSYGPALRVEARGFPAREVTPLAEEIVRTADEIRSLRSALTALPLAVVSVDWNPYLREGTAPVKATIEWAMWLGATLFGNDGDAELRVALREYYAASHSNSALADALARLAKAWRALSSAAGIDDASVSAGTPFGAWSGDRTMFDAWQATAGARNLVTAGPVTLERWVAFQRQLSPLLGFGMTGAHAVLESGAIAADLASLAFDKGIAQASVAERADSQAMAAFDVTAHNRAVDRFMSSAESIRSALPKWIPAEIMAKRRIDPAYEGGMMGELKRQLGRQRGGMSVRALFENFGDLITQIAPCVLMSPESVARFFPAKAKMFDIVVFDEASQIRVADAVGAMGRANAVVVVGDSKQMPPTSFAETTNELETEVSDAAGVIADEESILTECVQARVPRQWLSWHYRSQDESLITFSNHAYYDSRLSSFPAPWPASGVSEDADHGISLVRLDGHFNRSGRGKDLRTNRVEAEAIVREAAQRFAASPERTPSLGIITFNAQQRALIETLLRDDPDPRLAQALDERDGLFVKNLENVQGDERDTILFSVAFSANERGFVPLNFGPLSRAGGERRLNVAITRARRQVVLFASFDPSELRAEETASVGIKHLKGYLELAASGVESTTDSAQRDRLVDRHRDEIADELRYRGFIVQTDVGLSDFRVDLSIAEARKPAQPLVAVLLDGDSWRSRRTVADRDGLPLNVLRDLMKWPGVERVWLPEWLQAREDTIARLEAAVTQAAARLREGGGTPIASTPVEVSSPAPDASSETDTGASQLRSRSVGASSASVDPGLEHRSLRPFVEWLPRSVGTTDTLDRLPSEAAAHRVRAVLREIVEAEGPIHKMRLARLAAESFGLNRVAAARAEAILRCLPPEFMRSDDRACAWPSGVDPLEWREARKSQPGDRRNLDHVPLEEIANAMAVVAELAGGMNEDEIKRQALTVFGGKRLTEGVASRLAAGLQRGLDTVRLERDERGLVRGATR